MSKKLMKLKGVERAKYKKSLAYTREYCRQRAIWHKKLAAGEISPTMTLSEFRMIKEASVKKPRQSDVELAHRDAISDNALIAKLEGLIMELKGSARKNEELRRFCEKI